MSFKKFLIPNLTLVLLVFVCEHTMGSSMDSDATTTLAVTSNTDGDDTASLPDFDDDGTVGYSDFLIFVSVFGSSQGDGRYEVRYDLDGDGNIGLSDFFIFIQHFGKQVPPVVDIPNPNLRLLIEAWLSLEPKRGGIGRQKARGAPILKAEMAKLRNLEYAFFEYDPRSFPLTLITKDEWDRIHASGIKDLTGIEHATNLGYLRLEDVDLSEADLSPLSGLSRLTVLDLDRTNISFLSPLVGLQLRTASFIQNKISDISPLLKIMAPDRYGGFRVHLYGNPLSRESINTHIPALRNMGIPVEFSTIVSSQQIYNDNVFVLPSTEDLRDGEYGMDDLAVRFYEYFSDEFDFLIFIPSLLNTQIAPEDYTWSAFFDGGPSNDVKGIGLSSYFSSIYGSAGKLQGVIYFRTAFNRWDGTSDYRDISFSDSSFYNRDRSNIVSDILPHELMHRWANYIVPSINYGHWGLSSADGVLGGFDITTLAKHENGRYSARSKHWAGFYAHAGGPPYSPIELYLAGLIPPEEVPDLWVAENGELFLSQDDFLYYDSHTSFTANRIKTYTIEDIIAEHGPRIPDHTKSQKNFRAAVILLISEDYPATTAMLEVLSEDVALMSYAGYDQHDEFYNFYEATGGRATITMDGLSSLKRRGAGKRLVPSSYGTPPSPIMCH